MKKVSILIILGLIFVFSFASSVIAESDVVVEITEECREDINTAENYAEEQDICTDQFAYMTCPETDFVYSASNGCVISKLNELGWNASEEGNDMDRHTPINDETPVDSVNRTQPDNLSEENLGKSNKNNISEEDLSDINSALESSEGKICTQQVMHMESPETGFVYLARDGCVISSLENKGWIRSEKKDRNDQFDDLNNMAKKELSNQKAGEIREQIKNKREELNQTLIGLDRASREVKRSQNQVSISVLSLISMENVTGIGKNISEIAKEINHSSKESFEYERRIKNRGRFSRFFFGGDIEAAQKIENRVEENKQRIENIRNMIEDNEEIGIEAKELLRDELENLEKEQEKLRNISQSEKEDRGLFGRFFGK
ncbi:MAG: hypothetical protein ACOCRX_04065 [Candidatus Woesearchaeota archaeon]